MLKLNDKKIFTIYPKKKQKRPYSQAQLSCHQLPLFDKYQNFMSQVFSNGTVLSSTHEVWFVQIFSVACNFRCKTEISFNIY